MIPSDGAKETPVRPARPITFQDPTKIVEMAERGGAMKDLASRQAVDSAIEKGRGGVWLYLSEEQYAKLKKARSAEGAYQP